MENYEKKYKEALERARQFSEHPLQEDSDSIVEYIFPELAESEDGRISREITDFICWSTDKGCITKEQVEKSNSWLAWLEKQGEKSFLSNSSNVGKDEQKPAWSEEDEEIIKLINFALLHLPSQREDTRLKCFNWLESLKDRVK